MIEEGYKMEYERVRNEMEEEKSKMERFYQ